jgi:hypothetical protein
MKPFARKTAAPARIGPWSLLFLALLAPAALPAEDDQVVAVNSHVSADYVRGKLPNGAFQPETYAFGEGGQWGGRMHDFTIDQLRFLDIARTMSRALAGQKYVPNRDPAQTKLLIMVYWGTTAGTDDTMSHAAFQNMMEANRPLPQTNVTVGAGARPFGQPPALRAGQEQHDSAKADMFIMMEMANRERDRMDWKNATILGYDDELARSQGLEFTPLAGYKQNLIGELEENRYFVVLMAYDFQLMWKQKKPKLLWVTRFSIREHGNHFGEELPKMADTASKYFGQDSKGLKRKPLPEGSVTLGDLKVIEVVPGK